MGLLAVGARMILQCVLSKENLKVGLGTSGSGQRSVAASCEQVAEPTDYIKGAKSLPYV
jgi:hypothetical protein